MTQSIWGQILIQVILIAFNAIFACAEIAVISVSDLRLAQLAQKGDKRAKRLQWLTSQPSRFLSTIQIAITLSGFLGAAFAAENFSDRLVTWVMSMGVRVSESVLSTIFVIVITIILSYFTLIFGELVPKRVAMRKSESVALAISGLVYFIAKLCAPIVWILTISTGAVLRLLGIDPNAEDEEVSEEEIRMMVDAGSEKGVIDVSEKEMIQNVFEFDDLTVGEFCTHRTDLSMLWLDESDEQWEQTIRDSRHTRYPICGETVDDVVGILNAKDYFRMKDRSRDNVMKNAVYAPYFVPEGLSANILFRQMQQSRNPFAVVLDEHGGMEGVVTMKDLLEQLVGDLEDEQAAPPPEEEIERIDSQTWKIRGSALMEDVVEALDVELDDEDVDTFGGYVFSNYGSVPDDGTQFEIDIDGLHIRVLEVKDHKLEKALVCKNSPSPETQPE